METMIRKIDRELELVDRIAGISEELEDLVRMSKRRVQREEPSISKDEVAIALRGRRPALGISESILSVFRILVVKNLIRGRLFATSYNSGKRIGLSATARSEKDFLKIIRRLGLGRVVIKNFEQDDVDIRLCDGITSRGGVHFA